MYKLEMYTRAQMTQFQLSLNVNIFILGFMDEYNTQSFTSKLFKGLTEFW